MSASKWCSVCRATYRGLYGIHSTTKKHRRAQHRANEGPTRARRKARGRASWMVALRRDYQGEDHHRVRHHRRSPPRDGKRRTVPVSSYWRHRSFR